MEIEGTAQCPAQVMLAAALGCEELGIANKLLAQSIFGLWMTSSLLGNTSVNLLFRFLVAVTHFPLSLPSCQFLDLFQLNNDVSTMSLEIQLKPHHRPYAVRVAWSRLVDKYSAGNEIDKKYDEPMVTLRRNVFFSKRDEEKIK